MPCENCKTQFTVFKRKTPCIECSRLFCNQCLIKINDKSVCGKCIIFITRPISRIELLRLKSKDLIFYLQSKHISTAGCVEKEELVNLVITHCNKSGSNSIFIDQQQRNDGDESINPFDQLKQTCQNIFTRVSKKIVTDLEFRTSNLNTQQNSQSNISSQPRSNEVHTNERNASSRSSSTYSQNTNGSTSANPTDQKSSIPANQLPVDSSPKTSPTNSNASNATINLYPSLSPYTDRRNIPSDLPTVHNRTPVKLKLPINQHVKDLSGTSSGCDCSDDEMINEFQRKRQEDKSRTPDANTSKFGLNDDRQEAGPSNSLCKSPNTETQQTKELSDSSNASSFEELIPMAAGSDTENWQIINETLDDSNPDRSNDSGAQSDNVLRNSSQSISTNASASGRGGVNSDNVVERKKSPRRIERHRSDGVIYRKSPTNPSDLDNDVGDDYDDSDDDNLKILQQKRKKSCHKCGKNKQNLNSIMQKHIAKLRTQLESSNASDAQIKEELEAFLNFLEMENGNQPSNDANGSDQINSPITLAVDNTIPIFVVDEENDDDFGDDEGINVYGSDITDANRSDRFLNLADFNNVSELDDLNVKQLKELLMLNRVDFKGCVEKTELLDRVKRLWCHHSSTNLNKLSTDDICKICMDAPIECVILECGHTATCINCGKVLNECPICRQYIVRVVRFFKA